MLPLLQTMLFTLLVLPIRENHAQGFPQVLEYEHKHKIVRKNIWDIRLELIPDVKERVIKGGTELNLTCIDGPSHSLIIERITISWQLPGGIVSDQADPEFTKSSRLRQTFNTTDLGNEYSIRFFTMTLSNTSFRDTGYYTCKYHLEYEKGGKRDESTRQYVYISNDEKLVFIDDRKLQQPKKEYWGFNVRKGGLVTIPCKPTHPNVNVSLVHEWHSSNCHETVTKFATFANGTKWLNEISLTDPTSNWAFDPKQGLTLKDAKFSDNGEYHCEGQMNNFTYFENFRMHVSGLERVGDPNTEPSVGSNISFSCRIKLTKNQITKDNRITNHRQRKSPFKWFYQLKYNEEMQLIDEADPPKGIEIRESCRANFEQSRLDLIEITRDTPTTIRCETIELDDVEKISETISFRIREINDPTTVPVIITVMVFFILFVVGIGVGIKIYRDQRKAIEKLLGGNPNEINDETPMEYQIEYLPYDKRWEFPRHRLKLGVLLGEGCFGRVVLGEAVGVKDSDETVKTVAVKMIKSITNVAALEALVSELKILIYLGSHLNVVNLLGACTKQVHKGELLLIVEYCRFGNLQTFLINCRNNFINQVDESGQLKILESVTDGKGFPSNSDDKVERERTQTQSNLPDGANMSFTNEAFEMSTIAMESTSPAVPSQPEVSFNPPISTRDLISWSFQIARGMDYLATKKVLHGDLAARNVLLADDGVAKVADFGMAKKIYYKENYKKSGQGVMPVKWMAVESLTDRIFSTQSDVWSYGILLWEMFSIGKVPYPGMDAGHEIVRELVKGYRMEKPEFAPNIFGEMMSNCWKADPNERPTFRQLEEIIVGQLESSVTSNYLNMNEFYVKLNEEMENATPTDSFGLAKSLKRKSSPRLPFQ